MHLRFQTAFQYSYTMLSQTDVYPPSLAFCQSPMIYGLITTSEKYFKPMYHVGLYALLIIKLFCLAMPQSF